MPVDSQKNTRSYKMNVEKTILLSSTQLFVLSLKVHLTPIFFGAEMKFNNIHKRNLPLFLVSDIFKGIKG